MWPNPQWANADLVTFTDEILNGKLCFFCSVRLNLDLISALDSIDIVIDFSKEHWDHSSVFDSI